MIASLAGTLVEKEPERLVVDVGGVGYAVHASLQTLAENSVKFAVAASREGASIAVHAAAAGGRLRVSVEDDGPGFDASHLADGHGLQLLESRLAMTFGDRAALLIESRPGRTVVSLDLPFETTMPPPAPPLPPIETKDVRC